MEIIKVYDSCVADSLVSETGHLYKGRTIIFFPGGIAISWRKEFFSPSIDKSFVGLTLQKIRSRQLRDLKRGGMIAYIQFYKFLKFSNPNMK